MRNQKKRESLVLIRGPYLINTKAKWVSIHFYFSTFLALCIRNFFSKKSIISLFFKLMMLLKYDTYKMRWILHRWLFLVAEKIGCTQKTHLISQYMIFIWT